MEIRRGPHRIIASYASSHAFAPHTRAALAGLGYRLVPASTRGRFDDDSWQPDLRIVDARRFDRLPEERYLPRTPIIVLRGARPRKWRDARVVGEIPRPASLGDLYPLLQTALEENPRRAARAPTELPARCTRADRRWMGAILSLSAEGCLFRCAGDLGDGTDFNVLFPIPSGHMVSTRARVSRREGACVGLAFHDPPPPYREAIEEFVTTRLALSAA
ncbi:MAG: PilZ domain-containing protein [Myxococcota bacterium]